MINARIKKIIFYTIFEIIALSIMLFATYILWGTFNIEKSREIAYTYANKNGSIKLEKENNIKYLMITKDSNIVNKNKNNNIKIKITNESNIKEGYNLYLKIDEKTEIERKYIKVLYENNISFLTFKENFTIGNNTYYLIKSDSINKDEILKENLYIWLSEETPINEQNKAFDFEIMLEETSSFN